MKVGDAVKRKWQTASSRRRAKRLGCDVDAVCLIVGLVPPGAFGNVEGFKILESGLVTISARSNWELANLETSED